jgi:circadian clock protein KaiC
VFDESPVTLTTRAKELSIDLLPAMDKGLVTVRQVDPAELSPGELIHAIRLAVERDQVRLVVIDSLNGYLNAMPEERFLSIQLHELLSYLGQRNRFNYDCAGRCELPRRCCGAAALLRVAR